MYLEVPRTNGGKLEKEIRAREMSLRSVYSTKVKILERIGTSLKQLLGNPDRWSGAQCNLTDCLPCKNEDQRVSCRTRNITYKTSCTICKDEGRITQYIGESSNSLKYYWNPEAKSHMRRHLNEDHQGGSGDIFQDFSCKVIAKHKTAITRQLSEAWLIKSHMGGGTPLNTKYEYNHGIIP